MLNDDEYGPWNPGIGSQVPKELRHLATIFRPEHVLSSLASAVELRGLTGFALSELAIFRPQRLALHELLIRITADFAVPDAIKEAAQLLASAQNPVILGSASTPALPR